MQSKKDKETLSQVDSESQELRQNVKDRTKILNCESEVKNQRFEFLDYLVHSKLKYFYKHKNNCL